MKEFCKQYRWWLLGLFFVPLLIIYPWFMIDGSVPSGNVDPSDWLAFWGGFLGFYGTVVLGLVAVWQNKQAQTVNERLLAIEEASQKQNYSILNIIAAEMNPLSREIDLTKEEPFHLKRAKHKETSYESVFSLEVTAKPSNEFLVRDVKVNGISVTVISATEEVKGTWYSDSHSSKGHPLYFGGLSNTDKNAEWARLRFKISLPANDFWTASMKPKTVVQIDFHTITYTNIIGVSAECRQQFRLVYDEESESVLGSTPFKFHDEPVCRVQKIELEPHS